MFEVEIEICPYCSGKNLAKGYQSAQGAMLTGQSVFAGSKIEHLICTDCGSIVHSRVSKPEIFKGEPKPKITRRKKRINEVEGIKVEETKISI